MKSILLAGLLATSSIALAYDAERAKDNLAHEATNCSAYFMLVSTLPGVDEAASKKARQQFSNLLDFAVALSNEKITKARFELAEKSMFRDLDGKGSNIAIVSNRYMYPCVDLVNNPEARMKYWLDKAD
jgi:hypothetical protein